MKKQLLVHSVITLCSALLMVNCTSSEQIEESESNAFITKLGNDTLAIERFSIDGNEVTANVLLRSPRTVIMEYVMILDEQGMMESLNTTYFDPITDSVTREDRIFRDGDSIRFEYAQKRQQVRMGAVAADADILPFIDMVHWPFELMLSRAYESGGTIEQPLVAGNRVFNFEITRISEDSMTVKHPTRGTMGTDVNNQGELAFLEASQTTRALTVERVEDIDFDALANEFAERDKSGNPFGALSGRGNTEAEVLGASITIDYGTPEKRGRMIWGGLVSFGERWRTGANRATHFSTDKDLIFGELKVPAGEYTLFTIPEEDGGMLIINKQTGQNGQSYDESQDLGRVDLQFRDLDEVVEVFTITAEEEEGMGMLKLQWDDKELVTPFTVM